MVQTFITPGKILGSDLLSLIEILDNNINDQLDILRKMLDTLEEIKAEAHGTPSISATQPEDPYVLQALKRVCRPSQAPGSTVRYKLFQDVAVRSGFVKKKLRGDDFKQQKKLFPQEWREVHLKCVRRLDQDNVETKSWYLIGVQLKNTPN